MFHSFPFRLIWSLFIFYYLLVEIQGLPPPPHQNVIIPISNIRQNVPGVSSAWQQLPFSGINNNTVQMLTILREPKVVIQQGQKGGGLTRRRVRRSIFARASKYMCSWILGSVRNLTLQNPGSPDGAVTTTPLSSGADFIVRECVTKVLFPETTTSSPRPLGVDEGEGEPPGFLLVTNSTSVLRIDLNQPDRIEKLFLGSSSVEQPGSVDFDLKNNYLYWVDHGTAIKRIQLMSGNQEEEEEPEVLVSLNGDSSIFGLALDWMSGHVYFTDNRHSTIEVIKMDQVGSGSAFRKRLLTRPHVSTPTGIVVHPAKGYIFWMDMPPSHSPFIGRAHLDGSHASKIVGGNGLVSPTSPRGLALDYSGERIYWMSGGYSRMMSADLNGRDLKLVLERDVRPLRPAAFGIYDSTLYWSHSMARALYRAPLQADITVRPSSMSKLIGDIHHPDDLKVYGRGSSQQGENPCTHSSDCKYFCMVSPGPEPRTVSCLCPDGFTEPNRECV